MQQAKKNCRLQCFIINKQAVSTSTMLNNMGFIITLVIWRIKQELNTGMQSFCPEGVWAQSINLTLI